MGKETGMDRNKFRKLIKTRCFSRPDGYSRGLDSFLLIPKRGSKGVGVPTWNNICLSALFRGWNTTKNMSAMATYPLSRLGYHYHGINPLATPDDAVIDEEFHLRYVKWLQDDSPFAKLFIDKTSPEDVMKHGVTLSLSKGLIPAAQASVLLRFLAEHQESAKLVDPILEMTSLPYPHNMNLAVLLANISSNTMQVPVFMGHRFINAGDLTEKVVRNWIIGKKIRNRRDDSRGWVDTFSPSLKVRGNPIQWPKFEAVDTAKSSGHNAKLKALYEKFGIRLYDSVERDSVKLTQQIVRNIEVSLVPELLT